MNYDDIKQNIIDDFRKDAPEEFISEIVDRLVSEFSMKDCMYFLTVGNPVYMDNVYRMVRIYINHRKQQNEKKLASCRCIYSLCNDTDILEKIMTS